MKSKKCSYLLYNLPCVQCSSKKKQKINLTMSFTKIPNFSNCNIWLPQQQLNIVMKYYHTRVKSTSFLKFSSLFLVKCHLYNKHFFFQQHKQFYNYAHYCNTVIFFFQWEGKKDPVAFYWWVDFKVPPLCSCATSHSLTWQVRPWNDQPCRM